MSACLKKQGITLPTPSAGGAPTGTSGVGGPGAGGAPKLPAGVTQAQFQAAMKQCGGGSFGGPGGGAPPSGTGKGTPPSGSGTQSSASAPAPFKATGG